VKPLYGFPGCGYFSAGPPIILISQSAAAANQLVEIVAIANARRALHNRGTQSKRGTTVALVPSTLQNGRLSYANLHWFYSKLTALSIMLYTLYTCTAKGVFQGETTWWSNQIDC